MCVGDSVIITCYLFPPSPGNYSGFAFLSFNGSTPETVSDINVQFASIGDAATLFIPVIGDSDRIQLKITNFQVSDSNTLHPIHP